MCRLRQLARVILPWRIRHWLLQYRRIRFTGEYRSWEEARVTSSGYDDAKILEKVAHATREVMSGRAAFERDSILFEEPAPDPAILATLCAAARGRSLRVLDFGGALGSSYHQHRQFLTGIDALEWHVIEQSHYALLGRREFQTRELRFHDNTDTATETGPPDVVLMASVLQYLEDPWRTLARLAELRASRWIVARTPFSAEMRDCIVVQHVPPAIYRASYPAWVFSRQRFEHFWTARAHTLAWHPEDDGAFRVGEIAFDFHTAVIQR